MKTGIELIIEERQRQITQEGYDSKHDESHIDGELAFAAAIYASPVLLYEKDERYVNKTIFNVASMDENGWGMDLPRHGNLLLDNRVYSKEKRIRQLVKAAALLAAEIDRIQNSLNTGAASDPDLDY